MGHVFLFFIRYPLLFQPNLNQAMRQNTLHSYGLLQCPHLQENKPSQNPHLREPPLFTVSVSTAILRPNRHHLLVAIESWTFADNYSGQVTFSWRSFFSWVWCLSQASPQHAQNKTNIINSKPSQSPTPTRSTQTKQTKKQTKTTIKVKNKNKRGKKPT